MIENLIDRIAFEADQRKRKTRDSLLDLRKFGAKKRVMAGQFETPDSRGELHALDLSGIDVKTLIRLYQVLNIRHQAEKEWIMTCNAEAQTEFAMPVDIYSERVKSYVKNFDLSKTILSNNDLKMEIKVEGNYTHYGDIIENGGMKIVNNYGSEKKKQPLTEETLKAKVDGILERIENQRLWFPVCKYMMWENMVADGDFNSACAILQKLYPDVAFNPKDLGSLNALSFRKSLDEWDNEKAPITDHNTYNKYYSIAKYLVES